ncbi:hypothetical protein ACFLWM_01950 [Chloroflexota bacterium]
MGYDDRYKHNDVIYLVPIKMGDEQLVETQVRMLCCDEKGNLVTTVIEGSVYELAKSHARELDSARKNYAILGLEIASGQSFPCAVAIDSEQVWALEHILEHALKRGLIPDILKKYIKQIIKLGETKRKELRAQCKPADGGASSETTPEVLQRLAYGVEDTIGVSVPIYKAKHRYPLVVLERLSPDEETAPEIQRVLILDGDGDLAIIRVPLDMIDEAERGFEEWTARYKSEGCIIYSQHPDGLVMSYLETSWFQRKALDLLAQRFEETGRGERPISKDAQEVLSRARARASSI